MARQTLAVRAFTWVFNLGLTSRIRCRQVNAGATHSPTHSMRIDRSLANERVKRAGQLFMGLLSIRLALAQGKDVPGEPNKILNKSGKWKSHFPLYLTFLTADGLGHAYKARPSCLHG